MEEAFALTYFMKGGVSWSDVAGRSMTPRERSWYIERLVKQKKFEADQLKELEAKYRK